MLEWAAAEGWNPGLDDAEAFYAADPDGYYVAMIDNSPAAGISVVRQGKIVDGPSYGFLGLYLCQPEHRGQGLGWKVWQTAMDYLSDCTVALDGVVEQQANYAKSGFELAYRNIRYSGRVSKEWQLGEAGFSDPDVIIRDAAASDIEKIIEFDLSIGGVERGDYLTHWLTNTDHRQTFIAETHTTDGAAVQGVGTIRACREHYKVGPLLATDAVVAERLLARLAGEVNAQVLTIDVPEPNAQSINLATKIGLQPVFETARMYRGVQPAPKLEKIFGISTLELG